MKLLGPEKFNTDADYNEYLDAMDVGEDSWRRRVNGLCAGDYSAGTKAYQNTCGDGDYEMDVDAPLMVPTIPAEEALSSEAAFDKQAKLYDNIKVCSEEESAEIDKAIFGSEAETFEDVCKIAAARERIRRKAQPVWTGFDLYFPDAIIKVAELSLIANEQHNPGEPVHWAKGKSMDHYDALRRHMLDVAKGVPIDDDKVWHKTKVAWRAMAELQEECDRVKAKEV